MYILSEGGAMHFLLFLMIIIVMFVKFHYV